MPSSSTAAIVSGIGKDRGAICMDLDEFVIDTSSVDLVIKEFWSGDSLLQLAEYSSLSLPVNKRNLRIKIGKEFDGRLTNLPKTKYRLTPKGNEPTQWQWTEDPWIEIPYIYPGEYLLEIAAIKNNIEVDRISMDLKIPFTPFENPWTWVGITGILALASGTIIWFYVKNKRDREKAEIERSQLLSRMDHMKVQAISSSLNPHFINNSLHWLQSKLIKDPEAVSVVARLSENIRTIFQRTREGQSFHSLENELLLVSNYLQIQKARYGE